MWLDLHHSYWKWFKQRGWKTFRKITVFCSCEDWISGNLWISSVLTFWQQRKGSRLSSATLVCLQYETKLTIMKRRSCWERRCVGTAVLLRWQFRHERFITTYRIILLTALFGKREQKSKTIIWTSACLGIRREREQWNEDMWPICFHLEPREHLVSR